MEPVSILIAALNAINNYDKLEKGIRAIDAILEFKDMLGDEYDELLDDVERVRDGDITMDELIDLRRAQAKEAISDLKDL